MQPDGVILWYFKLRLFDLGEFQFLFWTLYYSVRRVYNTIKATFDLYPAVEQHGYTHKHRSQEKL